MTANHALVSIIVPIYKVEKYLDECVQSIAGQTYPNLEIILVDDGSPDSSGAMCDTWAKKDSRIKVIHKKNAGVSAARNTGIEAASGQWILFVDADDVISVHMVQALLDASIDHNRLAVSTVVRFADKIPGEKTENGSAVCCGKNTALVRGGFYCYGVLYSRELISTEKLRFDESMGNLEDVVWNGIYLRCISEAVCVNVPYYYRITPNSITSHCGDYRWQIASWIAARRSIMNWFTDKTLTETQKKEVAGMFRHCQNNIYAECVAGKVSFADLHAMEKEETACFDRSLVFPPERLAMDLLPWLYYMLYTMLIRVRKHLG